MAGQEKKRNPRNAALILDLLHIVIGILVVICAILAFLDPEGNSILFPVIFWLIEYSGLCRLKYLIRYFHIGNAETFAHLSTDLGL